MRPAGQDRRILKPSAGQTEMTTGKLFYRYTKPFLIIYQYRSMHMKLYSPLDIA